MKFLGRDTYVGQAVEALPVDFNLGLLAGGLARNQSAEGLTMGPWGIGLPIIDAVDQDDPSLLLNVSSFGLSVTHIGVGAGFAFPILLANEPLSP